MRGEKFERSRQSMGAQTVETECLIPHEPFRAIGRVSFRTSVETYA